MSPRKAPAPAPRPKTPTGLARDVWSYAAFSEALRALAEEAPPRTSLRQMLAFAMMVEREAMGHETIVSELRELAGSDKEGQPILGQAIGRSYLLLTAPSDQAPDGLGWIELEPDPSDARRKVIRLTPKGEAMARRVRTALARLKDSP